MFGKHCFVVKVFKSSAQIAASTIDLELNGIVLLRILLACSNIVIGYNCIQLCKVSLIEEISRAFLFFSPNLEIGSGSTYAGLPVKEMLLIFIIIFLISKMPVALF